MQDAITDKSDSHTYTETPTYGEMHPDIVKRLALGESDEVGGGEESLCNWDETQANQGTRCAIS